MPFNQHCGAIYLRSKSYLVFKISSDIMTKNCCQICVLSMMFCRSDSRLCWPCWHGKWWRNRENLSTTWFDTPTGQRRKWSEKHSWHLIFTFYLNRDTSVIELFPVVVFQLNKNSPVLTHLLATSKPSLKIVGLRRGLRLSNPKWCWYRYILLQTRTHIMTIN